MTFANNGVYVELKHENEPPQLLWFGQKVGPLPPIPLKAELVLDEKTLKILEVLEEIEELKEKIKKMEETKNNIYGSSETQLHDCVKPQSGKSESVAHGEIDKQMKKLYKQINKHYKTINRELVNKIVHRFSEIIDIYYDYMLHVKYDEVTKEKDLLLPKRILRNEKLPEASTFDTVLTLVDKVFRFMSVYDRKCSELFHFENAQDWFYCYNVQKFDMEYKYKYKFNDHNIPSTMERFFNIDDKEIYRLLDLNFSP